MSSDVKRVIQKERGKVVRHSQSETRQCRQKSGQAPDRPWTSYQGERAKKVEGDDDGQQGRKVHSGPEVKEEEKKGNTGGDCSKLLKIEITPDDGNGEQVKVDRLILRCRDDWV